ncbi:hypothetical protein EG827_03595 [bacterium]|nr:hypothetical protein [bacterium]
MIAAGDDRVTAGKNDRLTAGNNDLVAAGKSDRERAVRLLLLLSRIEFTDEEKVRAGEECVTFNGWKLFADLAVRHGVAALAWQNVSDLSLDRYVPETERIILEGLRFKSIARVTYITGVASEVTRALEKEGIRVLLLKGLALEHTVYGSKGLRQMSDADLLVSPASALRARDILVRAGFVSMPLKSKLYRHIILDLGNHLPELRRGGISVDLHFRLFGPEGDEMVADAINEAEMITAGGNSFHVLPPVTAFLGLVSHISKHVVKGEFQLRLYTDIYLLLKKHGGAIINSDLPAAAKQAGIPGEVRAVMTVMEQAWGMAIPPELRARPGAEQVKAGRFMDDLMYPDQLRPESQRDMFSRNMRSLTGFKKKLVFVAGDIFPSLHFMRQRYGCRTNLSAMLYYPHRLGKLVWVLGLRKTVKQED